ncbi:alpha/beta-hydrolase [Trichocladium antarcticum]|uniref:Alpha/beta-hydrolase n=1 Tax=Trichocladium antarcticum TaxID=1450529 RepID=A0AAN6ZEL8_9PEZI|nr:alpha/beta-hydrolase [Trichocladium antarcticum]
MNTATVGLAVTPTVVSTLLAHCLNRKPLARKPTAHLSYDEGLHLIRSFLVHSSRHTVEELQAFTSQWVPNPQWVRVSHVAIPEDQLSRAAHLLAEQLGADGIRQVGGKEWWQWRDPKGPLKAEWIEMKADYQERKKKADPGARVMLYVHGGAYYFGSVDEHRYQIQRHARKLKARALAPRYRLAPQFPFPCGLHDCLATYLHLLTHQNPNTVILAGDSAGAGMILAMMVILRDRGIPLPAGAVLISPWVDLTHSFPSVAGDCPLDYIPPSGFHHKPSPAWPPPDEEELAELRKLAMPQKTNIDAQNGAAHESGAPTVQDVADTTLRLTFNIDGEQVEVKEQIQMYTTNELLAHPLVSPIMQPTLGGLPPLFIMVGGGELLRDEQIYLAHKCADPSAYLPPDALMDDRARALVDRYKPTDVQLQVWDDLCHAAPTLSFTKPAKFMYRSVAQFSAWALARAQNTEIAIPDDDRISVISSSSSSDENEEHGPKPTPTQKPTATNPPHQPAAIGKAGDPLPPFTAHMIRQRVAPNGIVSPLPAPQDLPGCTMPRALIGVVKVGTVRKWLAHRRRWDVRFRAAGERVRAQRMREVTAAAAAAASAGAGAGAGGPVVALGGAADVPPPSALVGRRRRLAGVGGRRTTTKKKKRVGRLGLALWGMWGSKHDETAVAREREVAEKGGEVVVKGVGGAEEEGRGARAFSDLQRQEREVGEAGGKERRRPWRGLRREGKKVDKREGVGSADSQPAVPVDTERGEGGPSSRTTTFLSPDDYDTGSTGKRVMLGGVAMPFSLRKEPETASMITLASRMDQSPIRPSTAGSEHADSRPARPIDNNNNNNNNNKAEQQPTPSPPGLERFVTAAEEIPGAGS